MNRAELLASLGFLSDINQEIGLSMYFIINEGGELVERFADITDEVKGELLTQFLRYIEAKFINNEQLYFANISEADNRANAAYYYDLAEPVSGLEVMLALLENEERDYFNFEHDNFDSVTGFVFLIGNEQQKIAIYKKHYPISTIRRDSVLSLIRSEQRLILVTDDILKLNESFEFMQIQNHLIILSLKTLENKFGFADVIKRQAILNLVIISAANLLESAQPLEELAQETRFAKKLMRVKTTSHVLQLPFDQIRTFIQQHPKLRRRIRFNADGTRIALDTRTSKELFLKLLDDDFLKSDLTSALYDAESKDRLDHIEEVDN